jgi:NADH:ubiquinone oxidoreductase subunit F (NADH-binding)
MRLAAVSSPARLLPARSAASFADHVARYGPLPRGRRADLLAAIEESGLTGRGGGGFPTARKLGAVARAGRSVVVANGTEGEPASHKDKALMTTNPHLVLDGVLVAAGLVGASEAIVAVARDDRASRRELETAFAQRTSRSAASIRIEAVPDRFVAGEESALVAWLNGGDARPTVTPPRPSVRGVGGRPTLVQNVETLANLALVARFGATWFRDGESVLVTVGGAVRTPGVVEVALGTPLEEVLDRCGGATEPLQAFLVGGYFGSWIPADGNLDLPLSADGLAPLGASLGARTLIALPRSACGLRETARAVGYLAGESAGQCGPCVFGLRAVAQCFETLVRGGDDARGALARLPRLQAQIAGRGACAHPDGALKLAESALRVFAPEIRRHVDGVCTESRPTSLPVRASNGEWR